MHCFKPSRGGSISPSRGKLFSRWHHCTHEGTRLRLQNHALTGMPPRGVSSTKCSQIDKKDSSVAHKLTDSSQY